MPCDFLETLLFSQHQVCLMLALSLIKLLVQYPTYNVSQSLWRGGGVDTHQVNGTLILKYKTLYIQHTELSFACVNVINKFHCNYI